MCGIFGILRPSAEALDPCVLRRISTLLRHRGPDDDGWLSYSASGVECGRGVPTSRTAEVVMIHRRLSILDLSEAGWQPMSTADGRYHIAYNGEIYNFVELRAELVRLGHRFRSHSDTEVLLAALAQWGRASLHRLVGMFAFALLDTQERSLFLARDFFGIKPLFYTRGNGSLAFASELKALLELPGASREASPHRVYEYLRRGATDHGSETLYRGIRQLPPGHCLEVSLDDPSPAEPVPYWTLEPKGRAELSFDEAAARLRELFLDSVRLHLRSDVPVGAALSGGIDSSAIVSAIRHLEPNQEIHTFSYAAEDPAISEEPWIDLVGGATGARIHKIRPTSEELVADLDRLIRAQDEPFGSTSIYAQYRVFRLAEEAGIKVMLDGQGADELLAGYSAYLVPRLAALLRGGRWVQAASFVHALRSQPRVPANAILRSACATLLPEPLKRPLQQAVMRDGVPAWLNTQWFLEREVAITPQEVAVRATLQERLRTSVQADLPALLRFEDRNSMAHSIESRVPFLTPALAEFVLSLPDEYIIASDGTTKSVLRQAMRGIVPDAVLDRRDKVGFETPEQRWLDTLSPWVEEVLRGADGAGVPVLNHPALRAEWRAVRRREKPFDFRVWRWINLIRWSELSSVRFA